MWFHLGLIILFTVRTQWELEQLVPLPSENLTSLLLETRHKPLSPSPPAWY